MFPTEQSMLGYQPYQGPMPFQMQSGAFANTGMPSVGGTSLLGGSQGVDSFSSSFGMMPQMGMFGMGQMGMMGGYTPQISGSTLQLMASITSMMASVMQGLMGFIQTLMQSVQQRQANQQSSSSSSSGTSSSSSSSSNTTEDPSSSEASPTSGAGTSTPLMQKLAEEAEKTAKRRGTTGMCLAGVQDSLEAAGLKMQRKPSAYMLADDLAADDRFKEVQVTDLKSLPAGAIVVWDKKEGHPHGHISIALGDGREASDHIQNQITNYGSKFRVFVPVG